MLKPGLHPTIEGVTKWDKIRNTEIRSRLGCIIIIIILFFIKKLTNATYDKVYKLQSL